MKKLFFYLPLLVFVLCNFSCSDDENDLIEDPVPIVRQVSTDELSSLRTAVQPLFDLDNAFQLGYWEQLTGYISGVGIKFINRNLLDGIFDLEKPEIVIFNYDANGLLECVAVGFAIPVVDFDNPTVPEGFTGTQDVWKLDNELNAWTLHVWIGVENPTGIFSEQNPLLD